MADPKEQFGFVADEEPKQEEFGFVADTQPSAGTQSPEQQRVASVDESDVGLDRATSLREDQTPIRGRRDLVSTQIEPPPAQAPSQAQQEINRTIPAQAEYALRPKRKATEFGFIPDKNPTTQAELDRQTYGEHEYRPVGSTQVRPAAGSAPVTDMDLRRSLNQSRSENPLTSSLVPDVPREDTNALGMTSAGSEEQRARLSHDVDEMFENEYGSNVRTMSGVEGYKPLAEGAGKLDLAAYELATGKYGTTPKEAYEAGHEAISGGFTAATPLMLAGGGIAPVATGVGLAGSIAGSKISEYAAKKMGATPEAQQLAADIGTFIPGIAGAALGIRGSFRAGFDAEGNPIGARTVSAAGDRVAAGYAQTPEGIHVAGKVGPYKAGVTIPFGGSEPPAPELTPGQGQLPSAPISEAQMRMQSVIQDMTATQAGVTPPSQVPPPPPGPQQLTPEIIEGVGTVIASLPQAAREPAILEAHQNLAKWMIARGNFVGPDGQVYTVATEAQANKLAAKWVNEQIAEHDKTLSPTQTKSDKEILEQFRNEHGTQMEGGADLGLHNLGRNVGLKTHDFAPEGTPDLVKQALNKGYEHTGETTLAYPGSAETQPEGQPAHTFTKDGKRYFLHTDAKSADEMKELPSGSSSAEEDDGVDHRAAFRDAYTKHLAAAIDKNPDQYAYSKDKVPEVVEKMIDALAKGTANRESPAIRATLKELGIPNKAAVIKRFFAQPTKTPSDLAMERIAAEDEAERAKQSGAIKANLPEGYKITANRDKGKIYGYTVTAPNGKIVAEGVPKDFAERASKLHAEGKTKGRDSSVIPEPMHKFATTQVNLPEKTSAAVKALAGQIPDAHLAGEGRTTQAHVTVRYGLKGDDFEAARAAIEKHAPFKAKFGRTDVFPPSEHSDNAAVVHAPVEAPELKQMHEAIGKATPVKNSDFEYKPHATIAYVKPEHAAKYKGMRGLEGHEFNVDRVHISDRNGKEIEVPLKGAEAGGHPRIGNDAWVQVTPALFDRFKSYLLARPALFDQEHITVKAPDGTHLNLDRYENNTWFVTAWGESDSGTYGGSTMSKGKVEKTIRSILKGAEDAANGGERQGNDQLEHRGADTGGAPAGAGGSDRVPQGGGKEAAAKGGAGLFVPDVDLEAQRQKANEATDTATRKREQSKYTRLKSQDNKAKLKYFTEELGFDKVEHGGGFGLFDEDEKVSRSLTEKQVAKIWRNHKEGIEPTDDDLKFEEPLTDEQRAEKDKRIAETMLGLYRQRAKGEILDTLTPAVKATQTEYPEASFGGAVNHNQYIYEQFVRPQLIKEGLADTDEQIAAKAKEYRENLTRSEKFAKKSAKVMQMFRDAGLKPIGTTNSESLDPAKIDVAFEHPDHPGATAHMMLDEITSAEVLRDKMADLLAKNKAAGAPTLDDIKARLGLKPVDVAKAVEDYRLARQDMDTFEQKYDALGRPNYVGADLAKELVEGWKNQAQRAELTEAVHKESSLAARDLFYRKLARLKPGDTVQFLTGPPAAGKTTFSQESSASLTFETNLASPKHAKDLIDRTLAQGAIPVITYVYSTPEKSVLRRATRMVEDGRPSSIEYSTSQHIDLPQTIQQLISEYGDKISVKATDNSGDQPVEIPIEDIGGKAYNDGREKLLGKQQAELDRLKSIGAIPERVHQALSRRSAPADIREGHGEPAQSSRTGAVQASPAREVVSREPFSLEPGPEDIGTQGIMDRLRRDSSGESLLDRNLTAAEELIKARDEDVWREMGNLEDLVTGEYGEAVGADKVWSTSTDAAELSKALHDVVERLHDKDRDNEVYDRDQRMLDTFDGKDGPPAGEDYWEKVGGTMAPADVFPAPETTVRAADLTQNEVLSAPRAQARIDQWKAEAKRIGKEEDHSNEVVISLFDRTGIWSKPYRDAGYAVLQYDVENGDDLLEFLPTADILEARESGKKIVGVLAAPPCTSYAVSGARWWESQHDKANVDMVEKKYGFRASKYFDTPLDYADALVAATQVVVELAKPELFHVLENPVGRIASRNELPKPTFTFDPSNFGDPYTKKTQLWGKFSTDLPTANVEPTKGSFIATLRGDNAAEKLERSKTPEGFAYAFFMANHGAASAIIRGAGEADAAGNTADQTGRALADHPSQGAEPLEGTHPEVLPATVGQGAPQPTPGRGSRPDGELNAGLGEESQPPGARSGEGDSERELAVPRREVEPPAVRKTRAPAKNNDWFVHPKEFSADATEGQRLKWNMDALRLLKQLETDDRMPTEAERETLAHYVGWGALQNVFDPYRSAYNEQKKWIESSRELSELMTEDEFDAARKSTVNAHYTSPEIVRFMWKAMQRIGFKDGQIFEPSMGIGNFLGMMPGAIRRASSVFGNDLDKTSYKIAKYLYPSAGLYNLDYAEMVLPDNAFDLAISNVPFGDYKLFDRSYPKLNALIHDFFFIKTLDKINPGGVMAFITSDGTLDKKTPRFREMMADKADLVAAFRFPRDAFKKNAGTQVVTDLIILRKRGQGDKPTDDSWTKLGSVDVPYGKDYPHLEGKTGARDINQYYVDHPDHLLGKLEIGRGMYGQQSETMLLVSDGPLDAKLESAIEKLPRNLLSKSTAAPVLEAGSPMVLSPGQHEDGTFIVHNGEVRVAERGALAPLPEKLNRTTYVERLKHAVELRDQVKELISDMLSSPDDEAANGYIQQKQKALKRTYDQYVKRHGFVSEKRTKDVFESDPYYPLLLSLEEYDRAEKVGTPTEIFTARTIFPPKKLTQLSPDPKEALYQVLNERGKADLDFMQELSGKSKEDLLAALQKEELLFHNPLGGDWEMRDRYLSGYVREKLKDAEAAVAQGKKQYQANVDALKKVIPRDLTMDEIAVVNEETEESGLNLGATWIPPAAIEDFARTKLGAGYYVKVKVAGGAWSVKNASRSAEITGEFAGGDWDGDDLLQAALNQKQPTTYDSLIVDGKEVKKVNQDKTIAAREAMRKIKRAFRDHIVEHPKWAPELAAVYNEKMRGLVTPSYDGSHLTFPGMNPAIKLRAHQANAIWRVIMEGRALLAHVVGAGKTYEMIASAMEMKRLGMIRKAMFAVPNHLTGQWAGDFQRLYPGSRVLMPGKKDFDKINRNRTMARIATGNWDAIVLPHSQFNLMDISAERMRRTMQHEFDELEETLSAAREENGKRDFTVKQLEKAKARLEARMSSLNSLKADATIKFDDLGVDHLFVDEAHEYKNLTFYSKMGNISGLPRTETKKTLRLKAKTDYLLEKQQNRGVVFATGTPIANTMAEMYHMTRYLAPDVLEKAGIRFFDDWAANFGRVIPIMELSADGRTYRSRNKFAQFANVPELLMMFHSFADVKTAADLNLPTPKIEGGRPQPITAPSNDIIEPYIKALVRRAKIIRGESVEVLDDFGNPLIRDGQVVMRQYERPDPSVDNMLKVTGEGRKIATDPRLINPALEDYPKSKTNMVVDKIYSHWFDPWARKNKATGLVFLDNYQHVDEDGNPDFNLYHDMRDKLIARGVPAAEIAIVHDYGKPEQKQQLFDRMNAGEVRVLFGSTAKMGAGMNVQRRLKWLIDMDSPWKPGELEQRHGRILRQGNMFFDADPNFEVALHHAITEGSFDTYMLQTLEGKAEFIQQVMSGNYDQRFMTDAAGDMVLSLEELKAIASGNPDVKLKMELESEVAKLRALKRQFQAQIRVRKYDAQTAREMAATYHAIAAAAQKTLETWEEATAGEKWHLKVLGRDFEERSKASEWLKEQPNPITNFHIEFNGLHVPVSYDNNKVMHYMMPYGQGQFPVPSNNLAGLIPSIEARMRNLESSEIESSTDRAAAQLTKAEKLEKLSATYEKEAKLAEKEKELDEVNRRLGISDAKAAMEQEVNAEAGTESEAAPETEEGEEPVADLAPDGYSADAPIGRELHYDPPPSADQPGIVTVNVVDALALPAAMNVPPFHGVSLSPQDAVRAAARLRKDDPEVHPGIMAGRRRVAAILDMAAKDAGDAGVIVMVDSGNSQRYQRTLREEMFHATQRVLGLGEIRDHITDPGALVNHPVTRKVLPALAAKGYQNWDDAIIVSELAAKIAAGQPEIFEYITAEEAADWYIGYLDQIEARAGLEGVDKIKKAVAMHDAAMSIFDAAQERRKTRSEENAKRAQQPTEAGTGLARDEEIGRNLPQQPKAPAPAGGGGSNTAGGKKAGAVASTRQVPVFYSQLYRAIDAKMPNVATSAQVRAIVANPQNGVKPDEAKWLGLDEFLADKPKVGKEEVLDFIRQNQVQVKEIGWRARIRARTAIASSTNASAPARRLTPAEMRDLESSTPIPSHPRARRSSLVQSYNSLAERITASCC
jgi:N12 class adenine-specific DNA methylase/2'-5' RNA ligase